MSEIPAPPVFTVPKNPPPSIVQGVPCPFCKNEVAVVTMPPFLSMILFHTTDGQPLPRQGLVELPLTVCQGSGTCLHSWVKPPTPPSLEGVFAAGHAAFLAGKERDVPDEFFHPKGWTDKAEDAADDLREQWLAGWDRAQAEARPKVPSGWIRVSKLDTGTRAKLGGMWLQVRDVAFVQDGIVREVGPVTAESCLGARIHLREGILPMETYPQHGILTWETAEEVMALIAQACPEPQKL